MRWARLPVLVLTYGTIAMSLAQPVEPEVGTLGSGTFLLTRPANTVPPPAEIQRTPELEGPMPSNRWWTSLAWERWSQPVFADPLSARASYSGMRIGWPQLAVGERDFRAAHEDALVVGVPGREASSSLVSGYSDWAVEVTFKDIEDESLLTSRLVKGSPYAWFEAPRGVITVQGGTVHAPPREFSDRLLVIVEARGRSYAVFAPAGTSHSWLEDDVLQLGGADGPLRIAVAPVPEGPDAQLELLAEHAFSEPGETRTSWRWLRDEGVVEVAFDFGSDAPVLAGLYPHQWKRSEQELTGLSYSTPRGQLRVALTSGFTIRVPYQGAMPALPPGSRADEVAAHLGDYLQATRFFVPGPGTTGNPPDSYSDGKSFGRLASLLVIAEQTGEHAAAERLLGELRAQLENWFSADAAPRFYLDTVWGALLANPTSHGLDSQLNDHAFHYGYFLQAAASLAERDPAWARDYGPMIGLLVRDTVGARNDPDFPFMRAVDPYTGHGWASGSGAYERGNNLESSSEAMNFAVGLIRWADAVGDEELLETGVWLYATQADAVWEYWFSAGGNFPAGFDHSAVGIVWSDGAAYDTWWTREAEAIHGINFLPITSASTYLARDQAFVLQNYRHMTRERAPHYWPDISLQYLALAAPGEALNLWDPAVRPEFGETRAKTLWFLDSLATHGTPVTEVWSDFAQSGVLELDGTRTYVALNPSGEARTVSFSDGATFEVAPRELLIRSQAAQSGRNSDEKE